MRLRTLALALALLVSFLPGAAAQQEAADSPSTSPPSAPQTPPASGTSHDRLFFALPNFLTLENAGQVPPLTAGQKFKAEARSAFDPVQFVWYGALAGIGHAENSDPEYRQGVEGYAKRFGEQFGDGTIENFMTKAVLPSVLHEDPRYFQLGKGGFKRRTWYALTRVVVTRTDSGTNQFNFSEIIGAGSAAAISTYTYHPSDDRNLGTVISVWGTQVGYDAISFMLKEFWPDIRRKMRKGK